MIRRISVFFFVLSLCLPFILITSTQAQQTLGGITGTVTDTSGALVTDATVTVVNDQTTLTRTLMTSADGAYTFVNLPIGNYTLTFTPVDRMAIPVKLPVGSGIDSTCDLSRT